MEEWIASVEAVSSSVSAVPDAVSGMANQLAHIVERQKVNDPHVLEVAHTLSRRINDSSVSLVGCLNDLATMSTAMKDAMDANPEEAHSLILTLFKVLLKQLSVHYKEMYDSFEEAELAFRKNTNFDSSGTDKSSSTGADGGGGGGKKGGIASHVGTMGVKTKTTTAAAAAVAADGRREYVDPTQMTDSESPGMTVAKKKKSTGDKKKKVRVLDANTHPDTPDFGLMLDTRDDMSISDSHPPSASNSGMNDKVENKMHVDECSSSIMSSVMELKEPEYLHVASTVDEALGRLVLSSRPIPFTPPEVFEQLPPILTYYIELPTPGCLGPLLVKNYINLEEDMQADLMCDILRTDCVEVQPFESVSGEVVVENPLDLSGVPPCAWRLGASEDQQRTLYTMYILVNYDAKNSRALLIQDVIFEEKTEREELLHVITLLSDTPQFAKVSVYGYNPLLRRGSAQSKRKYTSERLSAILNITKGTYERNGFMEVKEEEVRAAVAAIEHRYQVDSQISREEELLAKSRVGETTFHSTAELASLSQPAEQQGWGFSDVAKGAVRGAAAVVCAPVSVGKVVGSAVLDVAGVTNAIKNQTEGLFRKSFPQLASEEIIDTFNCAFVEEGNTMPKQGFVFITPHWLCFQASLAGAQFSLEWDEIRDIQKQRSVKVLDNAISIQTHLGDSYFLTSFVQRDQAYGVMMGQWLRK
ncbi:GRAM domain containing protein [Trypanosoma theileri]|uniref:GRAM domain containing protein n=1 Tax=Trypanosoma theileri TaxID=67003 RepID=A0A1X0P2N0_9TRYP|nr:GRAM domain containing protein [Trypanosoma theileri]ORC90799.1 GRAM domain containing protein [Trypanosoma theileri]